MIDERLDFTDVSTIEETITIGKGIEITDYNLSILDTIGSDIQIPSLFILNDYISEIKRFAVKYEMTAKERDRYYMRPDLYCYDTYGDINLDFVILTINDMIDDKDFIKDTILTIRSEHMFQLLSEILNAESEFISKNRGELE